MKIIIEPEKGEDLERFEVKNVYQFAIVGDLMDKKTLPRPFTKSYGDPYVLQGKLHELDKRLDDYHAST